MRVLWGGGLNESDRMECEGRSSHYEICLLDSCARLGVKRYIAREVSMIISPGVRLKGRFTYIEAPS